MFRQEYLSTIATRESGCEYMNYMQFSEEALSQREHFDVLRQKRTHILTEEMKRFIEEEYKKMTS